MRELSQKDKEDIIISNKLIADFMGAKCNDTSYLKLNPRELWLPIHGVCRHDTIDLGMGKTMCYHYSWDWLMPVVEKINNHSENRIILTTDITEVYKDVVSFIDKKELEVQKEKSSRLRPCDCEDANDVSLLNIVGISQKESVITVKPNFVVLETINIVVKIPTREFRTFVEWYLKEQDISTIMK